MARNDHADLIETLSIDELRRLRRVLNAAPPVGRIDLSAAISALRTKDQLPPPPSSPAHSEWRARVSGGRRYELSLTTSLEAATRQYEREWEQVEAMRVRGMSYSEAWEQVRRESLSAQLDDGEGEPLSRKRVRRRRRRH